MLLRAVTQAPHSFIVPGAHPVNVPISPVLPPRLVRDAFAADAIAATVTKQAAVAVDLPR